MNSPAYRFLALALVGVIVVFFLTRTGADRLEYHTETYLREGDKLWSVCKDDEGVVVRDTTWQVIATYRPETRWDEVIERHDLSGKVVASEHKLVDSECYRGQIEVIHHG